MAKPTRDQVKKAIDKDMPRQELVPQRPDRTKRRAPAQGATPGLDAIQRKYAKGVGAADAAAPKKAAPLRDDDEIVLVRPKEPTDAVSRGSRPKAVVVGKDGRIVGRQG